MIWPQSMRLRAAEEVVQRQGRHCVEVVVQNPSREKLSLA